MYQKLFTSFANPKTSYSTQQSEEKLIML